MDLFAKRCNYLSLEDQTQKLKDPNLHQKVIKWRSNWYLVAYRLMGPKAASAYPQE
jgi:hypothetical protein